MISYPDIWLSHQPIRFGEGVSAELAQRLMKRLDLQGEDVRRVPRGPRPRSPREAATPGSWAKGWEKMEKWPKDGKFYPLVNIQKTMENHHFQWENSL